MSIGLKYFIIILAKRKNKKQEEEEEEKDIWGKVYLDGTAGAAAAVLQP